MNSTTTSTVQTYENEYINISFYGDEIECKVLATYRFMDNDYLLYGFENGEKLNVYAGIVKNTNDITYLAELKTEADTVGRILSVFTSYRISRMFKSSDIYFRKYVSDFKRYCDFE